MLEETKLMIKVISGSVFGLILLVLLFGSFGTISAGEIGVKTRFNAIVGMVPQGLYFKFPIIERVYPMSIKTQTINYDEAGDAGGEKQTVSNLFGASKDLQDVTIGVVVNYHINASKVQDIYFQYNSVENYQSNVIEPIIREIVKTISGQYTAEELVTKRAEFSDKVNATLTMQFVEKNAVLERFSVTNFLFSKAFSDSIEAKVTAIQNAEAAKNKLVQVKFEAEQRVTQATAEAEAIKIQAEAITQQGGTNYVNMKAVEKWDGHLPTQMIPNGALPFINLNK